jgi:hypothetical protein
MSINLLQVQNGAIQAQGLIATGANNTISAGTGIVHTILLIAILLIKM